MEAAAAPLHLRTGATGQRRAGKMPLMLATGWCWPLQRCKAGGLGASHRSACGAHNGREVRTGCDVSAQHGAGRRQRQLLLLRRAPRKVPVAAQQRRVQQDAAAPGLHGCPQGPAQEVQAQAGGTLNRQAVHPAVRTSRRHCMLPAGCRAGQTAGSPPACMGQGQSKGWCLHSCNSCTAPSAPSSGAGSEPPKADTSLQHPRQHQETSAGGHPPCCPAGPAPAWRAAAAGYRPAGRL